MSVFTPTCFVSAMDIRFNEIDLLSLAVEFILLMKTIMCTYRIPVDFCSFQILRLALWIGLLNFCYLYFCFHRCGVWEITVNYRGISCITLAISSIKVWKTKASATSKARFYQIRCIGRMRPYITEMPVKTLGVC